MTTLDVRVVAVRVLGTLLDGGGSLSRLLPSAADSVPPADRALLQSLCFDMARWLPRLEALLDPLLDKPLRRKDEDVRLLLLLGLLQLTQRRMPAHAAVDTAVKAAGKLRKPWARGLVNGVLRNFQRREQALVDRLSPATALACPAWMLERFQRDWPGQWASVAEAGNRQAPMVLRVNTRAGSVTSWLERAAASGVDARPVAGLAAAVQLSQPHPVEALPGFAEGAVSVQDGAAQFAAEILQAWQARQRLPGAPCVPAASLSSRPGTRLLDACAAPGGKTAHLLEMRHGARSGPEEEELDSKPGTPDTGRGMEPKTTADAWDEVVALDVDPDRLVRVQQNLERLSLHERATVLAGDAADTSGWWDSRTFDAVLLDAPCSGSGVIRRHPDIKLLRRSDDIETLVATQARLLAALWPLVAPGGCLLYATCSVFKAENEDQIARFITHHTDIELLDPATLQPIATADAHRPAAWGEARPTGRQILPGRGPAGKTADAARSRSDDDLGSGAHSDSDNGVQPVSDGADMDGFFYALLGKLR